MKRLIIIISLILMSVGGWLVIRSDRAQDWIAERQKSNLPAAEPLADSNTAPGINALTNNQQNLNAAIEPVTIPAEKNLAVPFTSQAPNANWDQDHQEFCEEASVLMAGRYFQRRTIISADDAEAALQRIKTWELDHLGFYYDTTAAETAQVVRGLYELNVELLENPTAAQLKSIIAAGKLIIVPSAGRELGNPNFTAPGPIYHNLVLRGYTKDDQFITNDPGTRKGEQYVYDQDVLMNAIHDWVPSGDRTKPRQGDVVNGRRVVLVVSAAS